MKSAKVGQFHELFAKLLTRTDYTGMDIDEIQKLIKDPQRAASIFVYMVNHVSQLHFDNLVVAEHFSRRIIAPTTIHPGDTLLFDSYNKKLGIQRDFADRDGKGVYFKVGEEIERDRPVSHLEDTHEILEACAMLGCLIDCKMIVDIDEKRHSIKVKFEYF